MNDSCSATPAHPHKARRRGRPTKERAATLNRDIRKASLDLFAARGFEAVSVDEIAAYVGVSKATLYARYPGKVELLHAIIEEAVDEWGKRAEAQVGTRPDKPIERLRLHARTMILSQGWIEIRRMERLISEISLSFPELAAAYHCAASGRYMRILTVDIASVMPERRVGLPTPEVLAAILLYTITGWLKTEAITRTVSDEEAMEFAEGVIAAIMANH